MKPFLSGLAACLLAATAATADSNSLDYREFKGANGKIIKAVLVEKSATEVTFLLENGTRVKVPIDKLSPEDQKYAAAWTREKAIFLQRCRTLTVRELLELRGYESFRFQLRNNSIHVEGKLNGKPGSFLIDSGAGSSVLHLDSAKAAGCKVGEMTEKIYGVAGEAPAAWTEVPTLTLGDAVFKDRRFLATDLNNGRPVGADKCEDAIFGADLLGQLNAVISYKENLMFLRPDLSDNEAETGKDTLGTTENGESASFRIFKTRDGKTLRGQVVSKTPSAVTLRTADGKTTPIPVGNLSDADALYVSRWTEAGALFLKHCGALTVEELLSLRTYESFQYERRGNHIFVDGKLNGNAATYMIDTGADSSLLDIGQAKKNGCEVGELTERVFGIGGEAPAAKTMIKELMLGSVVLTNRSVLSCDLTRGGRSELDHVGLFGADFMRELDAVITYKESRIFLKRNN